MSRIAGLLFIACTLLAQAAIGEEIYRTVDEEGNVTFTDTPAADDASARPVALPPGPSEERLRESEQRQRQIREAAEISAQQRSQKKRAQQLRIKAAEKSLAEAEAELAEASVIKDEDRQNLAGGKRRVHPDYFERVKQAEAAVEEARKALREARGY
ncbi:MAG: DUF4124 domain-containing protein [Chromatiales bacterium]|jgi:hypothetical protein